MLARASAPRHQATRRCLVGEDRPPNRDSPALCVAAQTGLPGSPKKMDTVVVPLYGTPPQRCAASAVPPNQENFMNTRLITTFASAAMALSLAACSGMSTRDKNTATGAAIGGVAGAVLTGGSTAGTVGGAAVGGVIGNQVDKK